MGGDDPHHWSGRTKLLRQNSYDVEFVLVSKHLIEQEHAEINVSILETLKRDDGSGCGGRGDACPPGAERYLTLRGHLVGDAESVHHLSRSHAGDGEIGVFIANGLR